MTDWSRPLVVLLVLGSATCARSVAMAQTTPSHLADIGPAPAVALTDQQGRSFALQSLRGKAVVVSFVFTTCSGTCPATTANLAQAQKVLQREGLWGEAVEFVSITLDPANDTPEVLARYARNHGADPERWHFLTGEPARVERVLASWDMWARRNAQGVLDHPSRIFLVDPQGRIREIYNLETFSTRTLSQDIRTVRGTAAAPSR